MANKRNRRHRTTPRTKHWNTVWIMRWLWKTPRLPPTRNLDTVTINLITTSMVSDHRAIKDSTILAQFSFIALPRQRPFSPDEGRSRINPERHVTSFRLFAGVNMGYMDNSYSNSNNGGSVNSQDSIWQMKSAAANGVNQPYDLAGYGTTESDYPTHPHYLPQREDYRESHNLSRQQFCTEPFATVVKSQKHVGQY